MNLDIKKQEITKQMNDLLRDRQNLAQQAQDIQQRDSKLVNELLEKQGQLKLIEELIREG